MTVGVEKIALPRRRNATNQKTVTSGRGMKRPRHNPRPRNFDLYEPAGVANIDPDLRFLEIALGLVRLDHVAHRIVNANQTMM